MPAVFASDQPQAKGVTGQMCTLFGICPRGALDMFFELMAGMEGNDTPGFNGNGFASAWIATRTGRFGANLEITKTRDFDVFTINQFLRDQIKKSVDHVLGLALV